MWTMMEIPPQPFGECSLCKRHTCGDYTDEDGVPRQKWLHTPIELDKGGNLVIGYQCAKSMTDELGITKTVVEVERQLEPTDQHILSYIHKSIGQENPFQAEIDRINALDRGNLKAYLTQHNVEFTPQWGDDKLKETAIAHIKGITL